MKCPKCGYALPEDSEFCQYCGVNIVEEERAQAARAAMARAEQEARNANHFGIVKEDTPVDREPDSLLIQAYNSYISTNPKGQQLFDALIGGEALRVAYLEECQKAAKLNEAGIRVNYKDSYLEFMGVLHKEYSKATHTSKQKAHPSPGISPTSTPQYVPQASKPANKSRYCKHCGHSIDPYTKRCTGCGKKYFKVKALYVIILLSVLIAIIAVVGYLGYNYNNAMKAMNDQKFTTAQQYLNRLPFVDKYFQAEEEYIKAGVLYEQGDYIESLHAFQDITGAPVPLSLLTTIKDTIYAEGQQAYRARNTVTATRCFRALQPDYKSSSKYLTLLECRSLSAFSDVTSEYKKLVNLIGFEDAHEIILHNQKMVKLFLNDKWEDTTTAEYYFEMYENDEGGYSCKYNLPFQDADGYFYLSNGIYSVGETEASSVKLFRFSILTKDSIYVYCYKDGSAHTLYRQ